GRSRSSYSRAADTRREQYGGEGPHDVARVLDAGQELGHGWHLLSPVRADKPGEDSNLEGHLGVELTGDEVGAGRVPGAGDPAVTALAQVRVARAEARQTLLPRVQPGALSRNDHVQPVRRVRERQPAAGADGHDRTAE